MAQGHAIGIKVPCAVRPGFLKPGLVSVISKIFSDKRHIGMGLQRNFQRQVAGHSSHHFADMPVFNIRTAVRAQVADGVGKSTGGRVKPEGHGAQHIPLDISYLDIAVNSFGDPQNLNSVCHHFLGQKSGIGVGIISANDHQCVQVEAPAGCPGQGHLLTAVDFGSAGLNHGKAAQVSIPIDQLTAKLDGFIFNNPVRPDQKSVNSRIRVGFFSGVIQTGNYIMPPRRRPPGENDADISFFPILPGDLIIHQIFAFDQLYLIGNDIRQQFFGLPVQFKSIPVGFPQNRIRMGKHLRLQR